MKSSKTKIYFNVLNELIYLRFFNSKFVYIEGEVKSAYLVSDKAFKRDFRYIGYI